LDSDILPLWWILRIARVTERHKELRWASNEGTLRASAMLTVSQLSKSFADRALSGA
jgi:hypothetical protein